MTEPPVNPGIRDVARLAGVNIATVSRILSKSPRARAFSAACVRRVEAAARQLGYRPNSHARSMRTGRANAFGVLAPPAAAAWYVSPIVEAVHAAAVAHGFHCVSIGREEGRASLETALAFHAERRIDGLVAPLWNGTAAERRAIAASGCPTVLTNRSPLGRLPAVSVDDGAGMRKAVDHLVELGHRRLLYLEYRDPEGWRGNRREAVENRAAELGLELSVWNAAMPALPLETEIETNRRLLSRFLAKGQRATAAICYNDNIALALYAALHGLGLRAPDDLSVTGFDDLFARLAYPGLTSVSHMFAEVGNASVDVLLAALNGGSVPGQVLLEPKLIVRASTRAIGTSDARSRRAGTRTARISG